MYHSNKVLNKATVQRISLSVHSELLIQNVGYACIATVADVTTVHGMIIIR